MLPLGKIVKVGRFVMGKVGRKETAKQAVGNGATGVVAAFLAGKMGMDMESAVGVAVLIVTAGNAAWEYVRSYEAVIDKAEG
jgi:hypothetical protein